MNINLKVKQKYLFMDQTYLEHVITGGERSNEKLLLVLLLSAVPDQSIILMRELLAKKFTPDITRGSVRR